MTTQEPSRLKRQRVIDALRRGTVPQRGLELYAVGMDRFAKAIDGELAAVATGQGVFKAVQGEYGTGKTFFARWLEHRALNAGFATAVVQVSTDTPLYRMETIYRRALESLQTKEWEQGAFRSLIDAWFYKLEEEAIAANGALEDDAEGLSAAVGQLLEQRLSSISAVQPMFSAALRGCHAARFSNDRALADGLLAWLMAQPNVGQDVTRKAGIKGSVDHDTAAGFLRGLLEVLRRTGRKGLVLVLDECETIQRVRDDLREKSLNAIRQLVDDIDGGRYPGLYVLINGNRTFFEGPQGIKRLAPLEQRLYVDFSGNPEFDNPKAVQLRLLPFDLERLMTVGRAVRELYPAENPERVAAKVNDEVIASLAKGLAGKLGNKLGVVPRLFLRKLVGELLEKVDQFDKFEPTRDFKLVVDGAEMTQEERAAAGIESTVDDLTAKLAKSAEPTELP